jgi:hypothetical protein
MLNINKLILFLVFFTIQIGFSQYTDDINSNRPGESQGAFAVGKNVIQVESGIYGLKEKHSLTLNESLGVGLDLNLRYGFLFDQLEFNLETQFQGEQYKSVLGTENRSAFRQITLGAKYLVYDPFKNRVEKVNIYSWVKQNKFKWRQFIPAVAVYAGANFNFNNPFTFPTDPSVSPKVAIIAQNQFSGGYALVTNLIADRISTDFPSYAYILTFTKGFNEKWSAFFEHQGIKSDFYADAILRGGATYRLQKNIQIDASISSSLKTTPSILYGGVGVSWRTDQFYKATKPKAIKDKKKKKPAKEKKKSKKESEKESRRGSDKEVPQETKEKG